MICDKTSYKTYKEAQAAASHIHAKRGMKVYKCTDCDSFHLTSIKPNKKSFKIKERFKQDLTKVRLFKEKKIEIKPVKIKHDVFVPTTYKPFEFMALQKRV